MTISVQTISYNPFELTYSTPLASDTVQNTINFDVILNLKNSSGSDRTVQISATTPCDQNDYNNISNVIADGHELTILLNSRLTNWTNKQVTIHFTPTTSGLTCAAFRILR